MSYHNPVKETLSQDRLKQEQLELLVKQLKYVYRSNRVFRKNFDDAGFVPSEVSSLSDIAKAPFMDKAILRDNYPLNLCCVRKEDIREMHMSSGSTGVPVVMPYTAYDLAQWAECMARCYRMAGAETGAPVQITPSFGLFNGGFGMYHGARAAELFIIPAGAGNTGKQLKLATDFKTQILMGVVSYGLHIMEVVAETGMELPDLKIGIFGAEVFSDAMKKKISAGLGIEVFDIYGMTETGGVGTLGMDCCEHNGIHLWEDHYLAEVINPITLEPVPDGVEGELVVTSLTRQALPVIRFRTGDLTKVVSREKCGCGRTHLKISSITGRLDDMLIVKGVNFWPKQIEQALMSIHGAGSNYQIVLFIENSITNLRVNIEANETVSEHQVIAKLKEVLGFSPVVEVFPVGGLPRQVGKAVRVFRNES
jgi:phenylacetate-CoA ligase